MFDNIYILLGLCVFAFLLGSRIKKKLNKPEKQVHVSKNQRSKLAKEVNKTQLPSGKQKLKKVFLWIQVVVIFSLLIYMIPALTRDILVANGTYSQNLFLRILIVALAMWTLFIGVNRILKKKTNE